MRAHIFVCCAVVLAGALLALPQSVHATTPPSNRPSACTEVPVGATLDVSAFGNCRRVINSTDKKICALTATASLWTSWQTNVGNGLLPGVSLAACVANINGSCGSANGVASATPPSVNLCSAGTATAVVTDTVHSWNCNGSGTGTTASCTAPLEDAACPAQTVNWTVGANNCSASIDVINHTGTSTASNSAPGYNGSVTLTCTNGVLTQSGASCDALSAPWPSNLACWGAYQSPIPVPVPLPDNAPAGFRFTSLSTGLSNSCGIGNDGKLYCWWDTPVAVTLPAGVTGFTSVSVGWNHTCGIGNNGLAYCWGMNYSGQLGNGTFNDSSTPVAVTLPAGVTSFSSVAPTWMHSCGIGNNGRAYCWGLNPWAGIFDAHTPVAVSNPLGAPVGFAFTSISTEGVTVCGIGNNGLAYCWGANSYGNFGNGTMWGSSSVPIPVTLPADVTSFASVSVGAFHTCGIGNNGLAYCWGRNDRGQLGDGTFNDSSTPVVVTLPAGVTSFTSVSTGGSHSCGMVP
jgi:hypothetical protein